MRGVGLVTIIGSAEVYERNDVSFLIARPGSCDDKFRLPAAPPPRVTQLSHAGVGAAETSILCDVKLWLY